MIIVLNWNLETGCVAYIWYVIAVSSLWDNFFLVAVLIHWHRAPAMFYPTNFIDQELWLYNLLWYSFPCIFSCPGQLNRWHCQWGDQKASKSDHPRGQKRPTMGLKAWLRWRTPFYHRARRSGPPFSTANQTSRAFSSRGPSPHLSAAAWCWHNQSVECQPATVKWTTVKQGDRQTVVAE